MSGKRRVYSVELKLRTLARMRAGEPASRLAAEIGVLPGKLYEGRAAYRLAGRPRRQVDFGLTAPRAVILLIRSAHLLGTWRPRPTVLIGA